MREQEELEQRRFESMAVYRAINAVHRDLSKVGISKNDRNEFDKYNFRGIDAVYNSVSPVLAKHGLLILQRVLSCSTTERVSSKGGALFVSVVDVEFDLVSAEDGSKHTIKTFGEGMDRGDKSINKALTSAYKYALFQCFCIPVDGQDPDTDSHSVEQKPELTPDSPRWDGAVRVYKETGDIDKIRQHVILSPQNELELIYQGRQK